MAEPRHAPALNLGDHPWMTAPETKRVLAALTREGASVRFVGGCVRNALLGAPVLDIDIATPDEPTAVTRLLEADGIRVVPTGLEHGTVTAVVDHRHFEVTSLRRDVETDGRRAVVAFTRDFAQDAARRDFTINAIYAAADGTLFDPVGGLADLERGRVRFIGEPRQRIAEDYLRILRFFRMHAWYGQGNLDREGLAACAAAADGLARLSAERVRKELLRLLEAPSPVPALRAMAAVGVLARVLPEASHLDRLERLCAIEARETLASDSIRRLAAFIVLTEEGASALSLRLKLSGRDRDRLLAIAVHGRTLDAGTMDKELKRALYALGQETVVDVALLRWADDPEPARAERWRTHLFFAQTWTKPVFPLQGRDVVKAGVPHGPEVGRLLAELEAWWIAEDFAPDRAALLAKLKAIRSA
jgi:poly(A) polymerase